MKIKRIITQDDAIDPEAVIKFPRKFKEVFSFTEEEIREIELTGELFVKEVSIVEVDENNED